jgi:hypothetical protein
MKQALLNAGHTDIAIPEHGDTVRLG